MTMPVSLRVCLSHLGRTWPLLQWWLDKDPARFSLTVTSGCAVGGRPLGTGPYLRGEEGGGGVQNGRGVHVKF